MPCDQVITVSADFSQADAELVNEIIADLGLQFRVSFREGTLVARSVEDLTAVKRTYAERIVKKIAARKGWALKQTTERKWALQRR